MSVIIPDCTSCKNIVDEKINGKFCCSAFQNGIPDDFFWGKVDVKKINVCNNGFGYEEDLN